MSENNQYLWDNHISERIKTLVQHIPYQAHIADIGCDHGFLVYEAFKEHRIEFALAVDNKIGPLTSAFVHLPPSHQIVYSLSSGLTDVDNHIDTIIIAGMGGHLIGDLLKEFPEKIKGKKIILSPQHKASECRRVFNELNIKIINEEIYEFDHQIYTIIDAWGDSEVSHYSELEIEFGPIFLKTKPQLWVQQLVKEKQRLEAIPHLEEHPVELKRLNLILLALKKE